MSAMQNTILALVNSARFRNGVTLLILLNAFTLGIGTSQSLMHEHGALIHLADQIILGLFVVEIILRLYAHRGAFFRDSWSIFDLLIVTISLIPHVGPFSILRTLRVLRVLRLISVVPSMRRVVSALFNAIPGMVSILAVLLVFFYICAVITTEIFGRSGDDTLIGLYGTLGDSMWTLFTVMTLEGWMNEIAQPTMELFPNAWVFFVLFITIATYGVLNLFIGVIVDALNILRQQSEPQLIQTDQSDVTAGLTAVHTELAALRQEIAQLRAQRNT